MTTSTDGTVPDFLSTYEEEKYRTNTQWAETFDAAYDAAADVGAGHWQARAFATVAADLAAAGKSLPMMASQQADRDATDALLERLRATEPAPPPEVEHPDHAQAALTRGVAALNASRGGTRAEPETGADAPAEGACGATEAGSGNGQPDAVASAFKKATASINANR